jgi:hypothetical protein
VGVARFFLIPDIFDNKTGKILAQLKKNSRKNFQSGVPNLLLPSVHGYWIPRFPRSDRCPLYPQYRTSLNAIAMSALCHKQKSFSFDNFVSELLELLRGAGRRATAT